MPGQRDIPDQENSFRSKIRGNLVVQEYVRSPLLIDGRKFDLRLYVVVTSVFPYFRAFIHQRGLVRLCSVEYVQPKGSNLEKVEMHLTNFAVNRNSNVEVKQGLEWFWNWYEKMSSSLGAERNCGKR